MAFRAFNCKRCGAEVYTDYHQDSVTCIVNNSCK